MMTKAKQNTKLRIKDIIRQIELDTTYDPLKTNTLQDIYSVHKTSKSEQLEQEMKRQML
jgi:hypothetical protein